MAHGFSAVKEMYLDRFAEAFAAGGLGALVFDNRNFGASDGEPRQHVDPWQQVRDYRDAITFATFAGIRRVGRRLSSCGPAGETSSLRPRDRRAGASVGVEHLLVRGEPRLHGVDLRRRGIGGIGRGGEAAV